uniref:Uncharacterized protein n=1 Tax=Nelumbo nucifera TaxID=4432 RepID=A0A822YEH8_NELNU|nr:TPA_asm: hypothetical protein HUJ06_031127 [Nelumbo nucifera]
MRKLAFGTKIETMSSGHCIAVTSAGNNAKIFVGGVEITQSDIFNNGIIVVHSLNGFVAPLSPFSCNVERMTSLSFRIQNTRIDIDTRGRESACRKAMV